MAATMNDDRRMPWQFKVYQRVSDSKWCVFVTHDKTPEWSRLLAEFPSKDRAVSYAEIENDIAADGDITSFPDVDAAPDTLPAPPVSAVAPENFRPIREEVPRPPSPAEKARVGAHLIDTAAAETGGSHVVISDADSDVVITAPVGSFIAKELAGVSIRRDVEPQQNPGPHGLPEGEHGRRRGLILQAIKDHIKEQDEFPSQSEIAGRSGVAQGSLATYLSQLVQQGELAKDAAGCRYLKSRPDRPAKPQYGEQKRAAEKLYTEPPPRINVKPEVASAVASFAVMTKTPIRKEIDDADQTGDLDQRIQRRCQACNLIFEAGSIQQYLCEDCDRSAARLR